MKVTNFWYAKATGRGLKVTPLYYRSSSRRNCKPGSSRKSTPLRKHIAAGVRTESQWAESISLKPQDALPA